MKIVKQDFICLLPTIIFLFLIAPYFGQAPSLDPMINYRHSAFFFQGGFPAIISEGSTAHPPLLYLIDSLFFGLFGQQPISINLLGIILFIFSSLTLYWIVKQVFQYKAAIAATLLLFLNPLIMVNFFYVTSEILILSGIIFTLWCYLNQKLILLSFSLVLLTLMKETSTSIVITLFSVWSTLIFFQKTSTGSKITGLLKLGLIFTPAFITLFLWHQYLIFLGTTEWRDTTFIANGAGSYEIVIHNLLTLQIFNHFLKGNLINAFWLNFQWVYLLIIILITPWSWKKIINLFQNKIQINFLITVISIALAYILLVLSFPTWTIPRYSIPILLPFYLILALGLSTLKIFIFDFLLVFLVILSLIANLTSLDPVSSKEKNIVYYGTKLYNLPFWNNGPDRIMYNLQFLQAVKNQNTIIKTAINQNADIIFTNCDELKMGEKLWSIYLHRDFYPEFNLQKKLECINISEGENLNKFQDKSIYVPTKDFYFPPQGNI